MLFPYITFNADDLLKRFKTLSIQFSSQAKQGTCHCHMIFRSVFGSPDKVRGDLTKHQRYPIEKERNVPYPTQLASKSLQLGIERFCRCIGSARNEVIEYFVLVRLYGVPDRLYLSQCGFRNLAIPFVESCPGRVFCKTLAFEYAP